MQYSDNISCKLMQVRTLPCWPEGVEKRTGNYRIAFRQEMVEIAENGYLAPLMKARVWGVLAKRSRGKLGWSLAGGRA